MSELLIGVWMSGMDGSVIEGYDDWEAGGLLMDSVKWAGFFRVELWNVRVYAV